MSPIKMYIKKYDELENSPKCKNHKLDNGSYGQSMKVKWKPWLQQGQRIKKHPHVGDDIRDRRFFNSTCFNFFSRKARRHLLTMNYRLQGTEIFLTSSLFIILPFVYILFAAVPSQSFIHYSISHVANQLSSLRHLLHDRSEP